MLKVRISADNLYIIQLAAGCTLQNRRDNPAGDLCGVTFGSNIEHLSVAPGMGNRIKGVGTVEQGVHALPRSTHPFVHNLIILGISRSATQMNE